MSPADRAFYHWALTLVLLVQMIAILTFMAGGR